MTNKNQKNKGPKFLVSNAPNFTELLEAYIKDKDIHKMISSFYEKKFSIKDIEFSYKIINDWESYGLLLEQEREENKWKKFSKVELCWIYLIKELREIGFSRDKILKIKSNLFLDKKRNRFYLFDFFITSVLSKEDIILIIDSDGNGNLVREIDYFSFRIDHYMPNSLIVISFNKICAKALKDDNLSIINTHPVYLDENIIEMVYRIMREGKEIKEVNIKTNDGKVERVDYVKEYNNPENAISLLRKMLSENQRQEISVKQKDGKVVFIEQVEKS